MSNIKNYVSTLLALLFLLPTSSMNAQIEGNGKMITKSFDVENVTRFVSNFYADITLDMGIKEGVTITAESNIMDYIGIEVDDNTLSLDQKKWIEPTKRIKIIVGTPNLMEVVMDTHDDLKVVNIVADIFKVNADIGKIILSGEANDLQVKSKNGTIEASNLIVKMASVKIEGYGSAVFNASRKVICDLSEDAKMTNVNEDAKLIDCTNDVKIGVVNETRYIDLKIKNNSFSRKHFVVVGPKPDGRSFSYGFPMMPGAVKKENWTIGTKVYQENSVGARKLLVTLSEENEGQTVKLFN